MRNRIDLAQIEGVINVDWLFEEQLIVGKGEWRFALNEYSDLADMSAKDIEEWEEGLEPVWDSLTNGIAMLPGLISELKRCYEVMNEVILRAMDAREEEVSDIIKHGDEEYVHVDEITYPFSKSDIDAALDSKASE